VATKKTAVKIKDASDKSEVSPTVRSGGAEGKSSSDSGAERSSRPSAKPAVVQAARSGSSADKAVPSPVTSAAKTAASPKVKSTTSTPKKGANKSGAEKAKANTKAKTKSPGGPAVKRAVAANDVSVPDDEADDSDETSGHEPGAKPKKAARGSGGTLVIVESPAKAKTIKKYLGAGYVVKASVGHVKDLPKKKMGIDIEHDFAPEYVVIEGKKKVLDEITAAARLASRVLLAPDPDREGEAIAWHLAEEVRPSNSNIFRVLFNEITKKAITESIGRPMALDIHKFESQQARRILDRLVGYQISPVLWTKVKRGLSAGRVQSVAVRLVVEREAEIKAFLPVEYWTVDTTVQGANPPPFAAKVVKLDGNKVDLHHEGEARDVVLALEAAPPRVASVERKERRKNAPPPFITSKLQQEASSKLRFSPKRTMGLCQRLYEGVEMGDEGPIGLITYMRTDSTRISDDALGEVRAYIAEKFGPASLPAQPIVYKTKKQAQDAHEAIRPTAMRYDPETVRRLWSTGKGGGRDERENEDLLKLYTLIWNRFVACQMVAAVFDQTSIDIEAGRVGLRASGQVMKFAGFLEVYAETVEEGAVNEDEGTGALPEVREGEILKMLEVRPEQHFTQPPPRFSEATLVKELEEKGIGRPSTYAAILSTIQDRGYAEKKEGRLHPTELGVMVNSLLVKSFPEIVSTDFTAQMEEQLDQVEEGNADWVKLLHRFYEPFKIDLEKAKIEMRDLKREEQPTDQICEKCGKGMVIKWGRNGHFLACSGYPDCRNTKEYTTRADGTLEIKPSTRPTDQLCPTCGSPMVIRRGRFGEFQACSRYPECKTTSPISLGVACPKPDCGGYVTEKRSKRGKIFFGCSNYSRTKCDFVSWDRPIPQACPKCAAPFVVKKVSKAGNRIRCIKPECDYSADEEAPELGAASA
jgi:DNA topoisomerase-1